MSDRDPTSFTNLRGNDIVMPGGGLDNSSSVVYDVSRIIANGFVFLFVY